MHDSSTMHEARARLDESVRRPVVEGPRAPDGLDAAALEIASQPGLAALLRTLVGRARTLTRADFAAVKILPGADNSLVPAAGSLVASPEPAGVLTDLLSQVKTASLIAGAAPLPVRPPLPPALGEARASLVIPFRVHPAFVGGLVLANAVGGPDFRESELRAAELLMAHAEVALDHLHVREELARARDEARRLTTGARAAEQRLGAVFENTPAGLAVLGLDGRFLQVNREICELLGDTAESLLGVCLYDLIPPDDLAARVRLSRTLARGEVPGDRLSQQVIRRDGGIVSARLSLAVVREPNGPVRHFVVHVEDVSEHGRTVPAGNEECFRRLAENAPDTMYRCQPSGVVEYVSSAATGMCGYRPDEFYEDPGLPQRLIHPDDWPLVSAFARSSAGIHEPLCFRIHRRDGSLAWVEMRNLAIRGPDGAVSSLEGTVRDVTSQKSAEFALRRSEEANRRIVETSREAIITHDVEGRITFANPQAAALFGLPRAEIVGRLGPELVASGEGQLLPPIDPREQDGAAPEHDLHLQRHDGRALWVQACAAPLRDGLGGLLGGLVMYSDVTHRHEAEAERAALLRKLEVERRWLNAVIERSPVGIVLVEGADAHSLVANRRGQELYGLAFDRQGGLDQYSDHLRRPDGSALAPSELPAARALRGETVAGEELRLRRPDGSMRPVLFTAGPILDPDGHTLGAIEIFDDISHMKDLERLREEWTTIVAHDLRAPLTVIRLNAQMLRRTRPLAEQSEREQRAIDAISRSVDRLSRMVLDLLDASRIEARNLRLDLRRLELGELLADCGQRQQALADGRPLVVEGSEVTVEVDADADRVEQILQNLVTNAVKYGARGTSIVVSLAVEGDEARVTVANRGGNIPSSELEAIFRRFHRSPGSAPTQGIGLGLYITRGLVEAHGGRIWAESVPGGETRFTFTLPVKRS